MRFAGCIKHVCHVEAASTFPGGHTAMNTEQKAFPFPTSENHGDPDARTAKPVEQPASEEALDSGVEESFPASDPVSVTVTKVNLPSAQSGAQERGGEKVEGKVEGKGKP
jgi:hypothetical protein